MYRAMSSQAVPPNTEAAILGRLIQTHDQINREVADYLLSFDFAQDDVERMNALSELAREGKLSAAESAELDSYLHVGNLLTIMQSKARSYLRNRDPQLK